MGEQAQEKRFNFQAEVKQLLNILVYSLYTEREIFVRELVSNAADALDRLRYELVRRTEDQQDRSLQIRIELDESKPSFAIVDTGIGMTREELIENIGTIAQSGSLQFVQRLAEGGQKGLDLIGKFGVGFYSAFMVAQRVKITTRSYLDDASAWEWESDGTGTFVVRPAAEMPEVGTRVELLLKDEAKEYAQKYRIRSVIKKYSDFVQFPIEIDAEVVNQIKPLWAQPRSEVTDEQYEEFYKYLTNSTEGPLFHIHLSADAPYQFNALLFAPKVNPELLGFGRHERGLSLYAKKVMVQSECKELLPPYLRFVRGVVDSEDLPLNISRETLQENQVLRTIHKNIISKVLGHLSEMADNEADQYQTFWNEFGRILKEGVTVDYQNQAKLARLLRFGSSAGDASAPLVSLQQYRERMPEDQKEIYYLSGDTIAGIERSPHLELFEKKGMEVLYLTDPLDEIVMSSLGSYDELPLKSAEMTDVQAAKDLSAEREDESVKFLSAFDKLLAHFKEILGDKVEDVRESKRLTDSAACLLSPEGTPTSRLERILKLSQVNYQYAKRIMEVNRRNPLIRDLVQIHENGSNPAFVKDCCQQLYENGLLLEGLVADVDELVPRIGRIMQASSSQMAGRSDDKE